MRQFPPMSSKFLQSARVRRVLHTTCAMCILLSAGLILRMAATSQTPSGVPLTEADSRISDEFAKRASPASRLVGGTRLQGTVAYGLDLRRPTVYFRAVDGARYYVQPNPADAGYTTIAFQAAFYREEGAPDVEGVQLEIRQFRPDAKTLVFSRTHGAFLTVELSAG